jgi:hypothetical protein
VYKTRGLEKSICKNIFDDPKSLVKLNKLKSNKLGSTFLEFSKHCKNSLLIILYVLGIILYPFCGKFSIKTLKTSPYPDVKL